jgi:hypothetical protein
MGNKHPETKGYNQEEPRSQDQEQLRHLAKV